MRDALNQIIEGSFANKTSVGSAYLVFKDGEELCSGTVGFADRENNIPMQRDSICRLFSLTKPVTAAAAMILFDRGVLSPDMPVSRFFPEYSRLSYLGDNDELIPYSGTLTIEHLLTMTSGLPYGSTYNTSVLAASQLFDRIDLGNNGGQPVTTADFVRMAADIPLLFEPGKQWDYGISADILGGIIEKASDMRYSDFLGENIFEPLGMSDTAFYVPEEKRSRFTALYGWSDHGLVRDGNNYLGLTDYSKPPTFESGGAGLCSTIDDYSRFARMLTNGGKFGDVRLMSDKAFAYMTAPKLTPDQRKTMWDRLSGYNYTCFIRIMTDPDIASVKTGKGEFGWDGWTGTYFNSNHENGITVLYFTQIAGAGTTWEAENIARIAYEYLK